MKTLVKLTIASLTLALAASSFAFVEKRPSGAQFTPEQSQEQVEQQQAMNGRYQVLGSEDLVQPKPQVKMNGGVKRAEDVVINTNASARAIADSALLKAEAEVSHTSKPKTSFALWGGLVLVLGVVAVWMFKSYADKVVPPMPENVKAKTKW